ncbi:MAG: hypothetical protein RIR70_486 [Pseudomonadota bacterium]|jgi:hypothetical protein
MSIELNTQIGGVGHQPAGGVGGRDIELLDPSQVLQRQSLTGLQQGEPVAKVTQEKKTGPTELDIINTPGTIAFQHMQNYLATGDLASYNFAHFAAKMQLQQG